MNRNLKEKHAVVAKHIGKEYGTVYNAFKKKDKRFYEGLLKGSFCNQFNISYEDLQEYLKNKDKNTENSENIKQKVLSEEEEEALLTSFEKSMAILDLELKIAELQEENKKLKGTFSFAQQLINTTVDSLKIEGID